MQNELRLCLVYFVASSMVCIYTSYVYTYLLISTTDEARMPRYYK